MLLHPFLEDGNFNGSFVLPSNGVEMPKIGISNSPERKVRPGDEKPEHVFQPPPDILPDAPQKVFPSPVFGKPGHPREDVAFPHQYSSNPHERRGKEGY